MQSDIPMNDEIEIGVFNADGKPLHLARHTLRSGVQNVVLTVEEEPARAGVDPRNLPIDPEWKDHVMDVVKSEA